MESKRIGVLGGGQLGRMLAESASPLDISLWTLDPAIDCPASHSLPDTQRILGNFRDASAIERLVQHCDVLTYEIEHVDCDAIQHAVAQLQKHERRTLDVQPRVETVRLIQDKYAQKSHFAQFNIPMPRFANVRSPKHLLDMINTHVDESGTRRWTFPLMLKSKTLAYDGRGNAVIRSLDDLDHAFASLGGGPDASPPGPELYVEEWVEFTKELAVMVAKSHHEPTPDIRTYPVVETVQRHHICHLVMAPAQIDAKVRTRARKLAEQVARHLDGAGVYGVEMFLLPSGDVLLNEVAPRPHNSGHYTIEACHTSQFEQHLRCVAGLPLGSTDMKVNASVMLNVLGMGSGEEGMRATRDVCRRALTIPGASVHWYGKSACRQGRKMAHITLVGDDMTSLMDHVQQTLTPPSASTAPSPTPAPTFHPTPLVGIIMGSDSDLGIMRACASILEDFGVPFELTIVSAHRTPQRLMSYAQSAEERGLKVIVAGAGGAAHLPGMVASLTPLPVIGVPVALKHLDGVDSLHSIVQMPRGVPVACVAIDNATNAGLLAVRMLGAGMPSLYAKMRAYQQNMKQTVLDKASKLEQQGWKKYP